MYYVSYTKMLNCKQNTFELTDPVAYMIYNLLPCDSDESDAAPEFSIVIGGELSRTHDIRPADI